MPGGHQSEITFVGRNCPSSSYSFHGARPIWVDFVVALLLLEALREAIQVVKRWVRRKRNRSGSKGVRRSAHAPPPSELPLPGEDPADFYSPSAPPQPSGPGEGSQTITPSPSERRYRTRAFHRGDIVQEGEFDAGELVPVRYIPASEGSTLYPRHKLTLGNVHRLIVSFDRPPVNLDP